MRAPASCGHSSGRAGVSPRIRGLYQIRAKRPAPIRLHRVTVLKRMKATRMRVLGRGAAVGLTVSLGVATRSQGALCCGPALVQTIWLMGSSLRTKLNRSPAVEGQECESGTAGCAKGSDSAIAITNFCDSAVTTRSSWKCGLKSKYWVLPVLTAAGLGKTAVSGTPHRRIGRRPKLALCNNSVSKLCYIARQDHHPPM
jgi:hypothetical protein